MHAGQGNRSARTAKRVRRHSVSQPEELSDEGSHSRVAAQTSLAVGMGYYQHPVVGPLHAIPRCDLESHARIDAEVTACCRKLFRTILPIGTLPVRPRLRWHPRSLRLAQPLPTPQSSPPTALPRGPATQGCTHLGPPPAGMQRRGSWYEAPQSRGEGHIPCGGWGEPATPTAWSRKESHRPQE